MDNVLVHDEFVRAHEIKEFLLCSDVHFDSKQCDREMFKRHLEEAKERDAKVLIFGDFFDLMETRNDNRRSNSILPQHIGTDYTQNVINEAIEFLMPYKDNLLMFSDGNHETAVKKHLGVDVLTWLVGALNKEGAKISKMPYMGYVIFRLNLKPTKNTKTDKNATLVYKLFYHHGLWGGVISQGTQAVMRMAAIAPDADLIVSGHTHNQWQMNFTRYCINRSYHMYLHEQIHLKLGTYKNDFIDGSGFAVEKMMMPKPLGAYWLKIYVKSKHNSIIRRTIYPEINLAK
jgi:predicted phosphodiesterase